MTFILKRRGEQFSDRRFLRGRVVFFSSLAGLSESILINVIIVQQPRALSLLTELRDIGF